MESGEAKSIPETAQGPERLSSEQVGNLIAATGNHEAKAITLLVMKPGIIYSDRSIAREVIFAQGSHIGWKISRGTPFAYCRDSLAPIGLVAKEVTEGGTTYGYIKTDYGKEVGIPFVGLLLDFSKRHPDISLQDFFGQTSSSSKPQTVDQETGTVYKKRATILRLKIFRELLKSPLPLRIIDIARELGEPFQVISANLRRLSSRKVLIYEAKEAGKAYSSYQLNPNRPKEEPTPLRTALAYYPTMTKFIYKTFLDNPDRQWTTDLMVDHFLRIKPEYVGSIKSLRDLMSRVYRYLYINGYVTRGKFHGRRGSDVNLTEKQRTTLLELVTVIDDFQKQEPEILRKGREYANSFLANPQEIAFFMRKAQEHSHMATALPIEETESDIISIIEDMPNATRAQIEETLVDRSGRSLSTRSVSIILSGLIRKGFIFFNKDRGLRRYNIAT